MKHILTTVILMALVFTSCGDKPEKENETAIQEEEMENESTQAEMEWIALFDGSDLEAWRGYNKDSVYSNWTIESDGSLKFTPGEEGGKNIITKEKFTDFILSLDWKVSEGANSGFFWSVLEDPKFDEAYQTGPEIQVLDNERHPDAKVANGTHKAGSLYDMIACPDSLIKPAGQWNKCVLEINHKTNQGKVAMNGTEAFTFPLSGPEWEKMLENSKFNGWEGFGEHHTGHLGLQDHGDVVWFRDIKIQKLE